MLLQALLVSAAAFFALRCFAGAAPGPAPPTHSLPCFATATLVTSKPPPPVSSLCFAMLRHCHARHSVAAASPAVSALRFALAWLCFSLPPHSLRTDAIASIVFPCPCTSSRCLAHAQRLLALLRLRSDPLCSAYAAYFFSMPQLCFSSPRPRGAFPRSAFARLCIAFPVRPCAHLRIAEAELPYALAGRRGASPLLGLLRVALPWPIGAMPTARLAMPRPPSPGLSR